MSVGITVTDDQVREAMRFAFERMKLVIEPGGTVALASVIHRVAPASDRPAVIVVSRAKVDRELYASTLGT